MPVTSIHRQPSFRVHAAITLASLAVVFATNLLVNLEAGLAGQLGAWWTLWAVLGTSIGLAVHATVLWLNSPVEAG